MNERTMKEIPLLRHYPLLPLPNANDGDGVEQNSVFPAVPDQKSCRRLLVASSRRAHNDRGGGAIGVILTDHTQRPDNNESESSDAWNLSLVPAVSLDGIDAKDSGNNNVDSPPPARKRFHDSNFHVENPHQEESRALLRGLFSVSHSKSGDYAVFTNGIAGRPGRICISIRDGAGAGTGEGGDKSEKPSCRDLEVDLSPLMSENMPGGSIIENPVGTACFLTTRHSSKNNDDDEDDVDMMESSSPKQYLHLRAVDSYGTVLSLTFSFPDLTPVMGVESFLLPLSPHGSGFGHGSRWRPHPGSSVEINQVCFPTPHTVVFALNPHLYCVDLGRITGIPTEAGGGTVGVPVSATTRVWTGIHHVVCDPILVNSANGAEAVSGGGVPTPTPRKKARKSTFGSILSGLIGMGDSGYGGHGKYEYDDDVDEAAGGYEEAGPAIPSIAALTNLPHLGTTSVDSNNSDVARVATLHSDGSLRVWIAQLSRRVEGNDLGKLRIPSVQRLAVPSGSNSWMSSEVTYEDPPIPHPSAWDPTCRGSDAIALRGRCASDARGKGCTYEVALYLHCYPNGEKNGEDESKSVHVCQGSIVDADTYDSGANELPSGDACAKMQELVLPSGTHSVVDISWSATGGNLMVLLRRQNPNAGAEDPNFYDMSEGGDYSANMALALYSSDEHRVYSKDAVLPSNMTLPYLDLNHLGYDSLRLSIEEELDRFITSFVEDENNSDEDSEEDMETNKTSNLSSTAAPDAASRIAKVEAKIDRAGLLVILQPFGRCRPSTLAVHRAMLNLGLADKNGAAGSSSLSGGELLRPASVLSAMRKWKKRAAFQQSDSSTLISGNGGQETSLAMPSNSGGGLSIYHAFASATRSRNPVNQRTARWDDGAEDCGAKSGANKVEVAQRAHRSRWVRLLSEIFRQANQLDEVLCLGTASAPSVTNFLVRFSGVSVLCIVDDAHTEQQGVGDAVAGKLDELSMELLVCIMSNPDLRQLLCRVESMLYDGASQASSLVDSWSHSSFDVGLLSEVELLGRSAVARLSLNDSQFQLLSDLSRLRPNFADAWLMSPVSASPSVSSRLAISSLSSDAMRNNTATDRKEGLRCEVDVALLSSAASLILGRLESMRQLSLSRLILVVGSTQRQENHLLVQRSALRSILYSTSLSWAVHQTSSVEKHWTVLEECLSQEVTKGSTFHLGMMAALHVANTFLDSAYAGIALSDGALSDLIISSSQEPRVALRLLAPLVEYPSMDGTRQKWRDVAAECLLAEAAIIAKHATTNGTSPESLWGVASKLLLDTVESTGSASRTLNLIHRVGLLERCLDSMEGNMTHLPLSCSVVLDAIQDAISSIASCHEMMDEIPNLWSIAFHTSLRGHLWNEALRACIHNPLTNRQNSDLKRLILAMVDAGSLGTIVDMSLTVRQLSTTMLGDDHQGDTAGGTATVGVDLFDLVAKIFEDAAFEQASTSISEEESRVNDLPNYWGCLYTLHASRGNWRQAAYAMDMCGKVTANAVSSTNLSPQKPFVFSKVASKKIMDVACLSAQACVHATSLVDKVSHRYLLPIGKNQDDVPSESRLLTEEDLERRAVRALALRRYSTDEFSPDSVGDILRLTSRDTIDSLAMLGYYDQAISVAAGVSSKTKALPGGVDLFGDALKYILRTYLIPEALKSREAIDSGGGHGLQRSKVTQLRDSSSVCTLVESAKNLPLPLFRITSSSANSMSGISDAQSGKALQAAMAMNLLQQYTTAYSVKCRGLALDVACSILQAGEGITELPLWLKDLCIFGRNSVDDSSISSQSELFAQQLTSLANGVVADPTGLMRLFIRHHRYGEACDVVVMILSNQMSLSKGTPSSRLPEKGNIDYIPYDLIDMLWSMIESISTTADHSNPSHGNVKSQIKSMIKKRTCMENALEQHFELLRISEEGLKSARALFCA